MTAWTPQKSHRAILLTLLLSLAIATGCSKKTTAPSGQPAPPPVPNTPLHAMDLFRWSWINRSSEQYKLLFTADLVFTHLYRDSANLLQRDSSLTHFDVLDTTAKLFAVATGITVDYIAPPLESPDPRPGMDPQYHRLVETRFHIRISTLSGSLTLSPVESFFMTRGDSAEIPVEIDTTGFGPESARWWISRWDDDTFVPARTGPAALVAWPPRAPAESRVPSTFPRWATLAASVRRLDSTRRLR